MTYKSAEISYEQEHQKPDLEEEEEEEKYRMTVDKNQIKE
jgi:hypothetical protein